MRVAPYPVARSVLVLGRPFVRVAALVVDEALVLLDQIRRDLDLVLALRVLPDVREDLLVVVTPGDEVAVGPCVPAVEVLHESNLLAPRRRGPEIGAIAVPAQPVAAFGCSPVELLLLPEAGAGTRAASTCAR